MANEQIVLPPIPWKVGEHIAIAGDTGSGKTTLMAELTKYRRNCLILRTKPDSVRFPDFVKVTKAADIHAERNGYRIVVDLTKKRTFKWIQALEAKRLLDLVWDMGAWTLFNDELFWIEHKLKLRDDIEDLMTQGRSLGLSVVNGMQRPVFISRFALSEAKHVICFRVEGRDLKTITETTTGAMAKAVDSLPPYHFAHFYRPTREIRIGNARAIAKVIKIPPPR